MKKLEGLIAAAHTPFNPDGSVNLALVKKQAQTLIKQKVTGVYVSGTTGEGICCSIAERKPSSTRGSRPRRASYISSRTSARSLSQTCRSLAHMP